MNKTKLMLALAALNMVLAGVLVWRMSGDNTANAQVGGRPSDYLLIPGTIPGGTSGVVYVLDMSNGLLTGVSYDENRRAINNMQPIVLNRVFQVGGGLPGGPIKKP